MAAIESKLSPRLPHDAPIFARIFRTLRRLIEGLYYHDALSWAPAVAFNFFLSMIPLLVMFGYAAGRFIKHEGVDAVLGPLLEIVPGQAEGVLRRQIDRLAGVGGTVAPLAVVGFIWTAASGAHGFMDALETTMNAPRRPWWKKRVLSIAWVLGASVALLAIAFAFVHFSAGMIFPEASHRKKWMSDLLEAVSNRAMGSLFIAVVLGVCVLAAFYRLSVERAKDVKRRVWPGAVVAMTLWLSMSWGFGAYVRSLSSYAVYYGSLAAVAVLLIWFWLSSLVFLIGAELNAQLEGARDGDP